MVKSLTVSDADLRDSIKVNKETRSGQYICDCPFCGKENHFYIDKRTQVFECKKCWTAGNVYKLLRQLDKTYLIGNTSVKFTDTIKSIRTELKEQGEQETIKLKELPIVKMPVGFKVDYFNEYLKSRKVSKKFIKHFRLGTTDLMYRYENYILVPIYDNGEIRGFLGRYGAKKVPDDKLRYNNSLNTDFSCLLYGYDDIIKDKTDTVIITEGIFDKFRVDEYLHLLDSDDIKCVSTFGKKISQEQIQKLINKHVRNVIISWDYDALKEIKKYGAELKSYFNVYTCVCMLEKDLGDCNESQVLQIFSNPMDIDNFQTNVVGRIRR